MDNQKTGTLIFTLRREKGWTQKALAAALHVSDRTISKWERGLGCPDISLLDTLGRIFNVPIEKILSGELNTGFSLGGNMKQIKFYVCPICGNVLCGTDKAEISCCGRRLAALLPQEEDTAHKITAAKLENDFYITLPHEMSKHHYLMFAACVGYGRVLLIRLYPEQAAEIRFPQMPGGVLYVYCSQHGLFKKSLKQIK